MFGPRGYFLEYSWFLAFVGTSALMAISSAPAQAAQMACPVYFKVEMKIGALALTDHQDQSFAELSEKNMTTLFRLSRSDESCFYSPITQDPLTGPYLEIHSVSASSPIMVSLEGFTSGGKLYSVRSRVASFDALSKVLLPFIVYDGSGAGREKLGSATLSFETETN